MLSPQAGWLGDLTAWLLKQIGAFWTALLKFFVDAVLYVFEQVLDFFASIVEAIPVPDFLSNGIGGMFSGLPPEILYFVALFKIPEGLAMLGIAVGFRLLRKLMTLGQW